MNPYSSHSSQDASHKVLVLGDSGVGKSSLVHMLCTNEHLRAPVPTVGCEINVRLHSSTIPTAATTSTARSGLPSLLASRSTNSSLSTSSDQSSGSSLEPTFIEFYDVSGSPSVRHPKSRSMFYNSVVYQGVILVHDLCNRRSYENLWKWIGDYIEESSQGRAAGTRGTGAGWPSTNLQGALNIPLLVVGTKNDIASGAGYSQGIGGNSASTGQELVAKYGGEAISVCAISTAEFMPNSSASIAFNMFFNQIIDPRTTSRHGRSDSHGHYRPHHQTTPSFGSSTLNPPPHVPGYTRQPPTPTPEQQYHSHHQQHQSPRNQSQLASSNDNDPTSPSIPIMDFATFTGGGGSAANDTTMSPVRRAESPTPARSIIPTGNSSSTSTVHSTTKSSLRAQYERNRTVLGQYNSNMGVPTYTSHSNNSSRGHTPSGSRS
ncbi:Rab-like protein 3 [Linnemannia exigua]|uniref:Rab-like protein 3 n=1 Tax=Linnemannia exigua TaxID=604196 RepID=A0AAD4DKH8_9FUNG|nr:Rab-like protein 3 [Linnemannia exigua]